METGKYRIDVKDLDPLNITDYERIFKIFETGDDKVFYYYNILKKIDFPEISPEFLGTYTPKSRMPMTTISFNIYQDIKSWWIIYLLNKDKFTGVPFWVDGGVELKYILLEFRSLIYQDITQNTIFAGRHF
jgi:hypothetical protein